MERYADAARPTHVHLARIRKGIAVGLGDLRVSDRLEGYGHLISPARNAVEIRMGRRRIATAGRPAHAIPELISPAPPRSLPPDDPDRVPRACPNARTNDPGSPHGHRHSAN